MYIPVNISKDSQSCGEGRPSRIQLSVVDATVDEEGTSDNTSVCVFISAGIKWEE
jgi:hypothetical protein